MPSPDAELPLPLVLFDGDCGLCHRAVRFLIRWERKPLLYFASLQSELGKGICKKYALPDDLDAMVLLEPGRISTGADAAVALTRYLNYPPRALGIGICLPRFLREAGYRFIARRRIRWFGQAKNACPLPDPDQSARFLDLNPRAAAPEEC